MAPQLTATSATLKVGHRSVPMPTSRKSTTPRALRMRSTRLPAAPPATSPSASWRKRSPDGAAARHAGQHEDGDYRDAEETSSARRPRRGARRRRRGCRPGGAGTSRRRRGPPAVWSSADSATSLVMRSSQDHQGSRWSRRSARSPSLGILFLLLARDAEPGVRQRVQPLEVDLRRRTDGNGRISPACRRGGGAPRSHARDSGPPARRTGTASPAPSRRSPGRPCGTSRTRGRRRRPAGWR